MPGAGPTVGPGARQESPPVQRPPRASCGAAPRGRTSGSEPLQRRSLGPPSLGRSADWCGAPTSGRRRSRSTSPASRSPPATSDAYLDQQRTLAAPADDTTTQRHNLVRRLADLRELFKLAGIHLAGIAPGGRSGNCGHWHQSRNRRRCSRVWHGSSPLYRSPVAGRLRRRCCRSPGSCSRMCG
jgi:hypothetical protein